MYIAVKTGERAIEASRLLLAQARRGDPRVAALEVAQLREQLALLVGRVMAEASLYDPTLAALAIAQAAGDPVEAVFLLRAYRTTLPRLGYSLPLNTDRMRVQRRVSAIFKDVPGGQVLGPTFDYTQRLLDFALLRGQAAAPGVDPHDAGAPPGDGAGSAGGEGGEGGEGGVGAGPGGTPADLPSALASLVAQGLVEPCLPSPGDPEPADITRDPPAYPLERTGWLQMLARADEGWVLGIGYSTQRGYANTHPFAGDIRYGTVVVEMVPDELEFAVEIGEIELTECQMLNQFVGSADVAPTFTRGHGLVFGHGERKAMAMALVDRALRWSEFDEVPTRPAQQQEFVLPQGDSVEASGFVQHLKLPHYVTFESELQLLRALREQVAATRDTPGAAPPTDAGAAP
jgi:alpha-D-ribose 1-methylphosphonate 5-triphosphate synthase subunit PhnI